MKSVQAQIVATRAKFELRQSFDWKACVMRVKKLYLERRYKRCATVCQEILDAHKAMHPIHKAFFEFYIAICYESLGSAAHDYSGNKIQLLTLARAAFTLAQTSLPLPFVTTEDGYCTSPGDSFIVEGLRSSCLTDDVNATTPTANTLTPAIDLSIPRDNSYVSLTCSRYGNESDTCTTPDLEDYSPRDFLKTIMDPFTVGGKLTKASIRDSKSRLSQSLSCNHVVEDELVPSPLFNRKPNIASTDETSNTVTRALPPLPFSHNPAFEVKGGRLLQNPIRKTAQHQILPNILPLTPSPITPHFTALHDAFEPTPSYHNTNTDGLRSYLTSRSLGRYNAYLSSLRTQITMHISIVEDEILKTETRQREHDLKKAKKDWVASYWSFETLPATSSSAAEGDKRDEHDRAAMAKTQRIEKLRKDGWTVRKERYGWRGEYYEALRAEAEAEINE